MKKLFRNRTFLGIVGIVLSLAICLVAAPAVNSASGKQVEIVRVTKPIAEGKKISDDMVQAIKVGGYNLPSNVIKTKESAVGKYALAAFQPGDNILSTKVSEQSPDAYLSDLDGTKQAVSISIKSFANGVSGKLKTGDIIALYVADYGDMKETIRPAELQYMKLLAATTNKGIDNNGKKEKDDKSSDDDMPATLTVLATPEQVQKLVDYEKNGTIHASLVYRGTTKSAKKFLDLEDKYLASLNTQTENTNNVTGGIN
jgi:pilus assembly protein CpaB